jgi:hypothetical protein
MGQIADILKSAKPDTVGHDVRRLSLKNTPCLQIEFESRHLDSCLARRVEPPRRGRDIFLNRNQSQFKPRQSQDRLRMMRSYRSFFLVSRVSKVSARWPFAGTVTLPSEVAAAGALPKARSGLDGISTRLFPLAC